MRLIDITGHRYNQLTAIKRIGTNSGGHTTWQCQCSCGNFIVTSAHNLRANIAKSCGCLKRKITTERNFKHGMSSTPEHKTWAHIKERCHNPNCGDFKDYGRRGIYVCERWRNNFEAFFEDMGPRPLGRYSIERIDNDGPYSPDNCCWLPIKDQAKNKRYPKRQRNSKGQFYRSNVSAIPREI